MLLKDAMAVAAGGIAAGGMAALGLTRLMSPLLYDMRPNDPAIFASVMIGIAGTCLPASWIPARVEPVLALRYE
jgi:hypothetical protein